ncbi:MULTISPECIES: rod shape-determining protein MreD [Ferrimonas]|uniref:Rod shape-determining protein MreD n=1 Tax=Ferrimonas sediminum TaxID=718193 RepID=A0A1G8K9M7_9GAMM|nr:MULTISPECIES: rod shape-determining protein MreD [Ferrimonas]USD37266.1 rod shape-determining protein MreD [Ferrimonas sp. SCSIO 43195]SDI40132.1 rod shape-determining protein MreD [Ferrimonas sediminum]
MDKPQRYSLIWITILVALFLQIMPLPQVVASWRPDWVLLVLAYWTLALPHRVGIFTAFVVGLLLDVLLGATLGVRSLALSVVIYLVALQYQKLRHFSWVQQVSILAGLSLASHLLVFWAEYLHSGVSLSWEYLRPVVTTPLLWPWVFWLLRRIRRHYKVK